MEGSVLGAAALGAAFTGLLLWLWARRSAARPSDGASLAELARRYVWWERLGFAVLLVSIGLVWLGLLLLGRLYPAAAPATGYRLTASPLYLAVLAFFLGNLLATGPTHLLYIRLLGERFPEFRAYQARKFGFDAGRWMLPFYLFLGSVVTVATVAVVDWYVVFDAEAITISELPSLGDTRRYSYAQLLQIRTAPRIEREDGAMVESWTFMLQFDDGRSWSSQKDASRSSPEQRREMARFIAERSSLPWVEVDHLESSEL